MTGLVVPGAGAISALRPLAATDVRIGGGFWADRQRVNRERTIPHGFDQLDRAGQLPQPAARRRRHRASTRPSGSCSTRRSRSSTRTSTSGSRPPAGSWDGPAIRRSRRPPDAVIELVERAQRADGYLNTFVQVAEAGRRVHRPSLGPRALLLRAPDPGGRRVAPRAGRRPAAARSRCGRSRRVDASSGRTAARSIDGHPEIEMALVELYRVTGEPPAPRRSPRRFIERRGHGRLGAGRFGAALLAGPRPGARGGDRSPATPSASSTSTVARSTSRRSSATGSCSTPCVRRWRDMVATRTYLTGGVGRRHRDEAFGDPFELPPDQAYAESCAAIAQRDARLAPAPRDREIRRAPTSSSGRCTNGVLPGIGLDGTSFFYVNPLQRRTERVASGPGDRRAPGLVPVRLLPAEPDADAELVAAAPGDDRRERDPAPPVRAGRGLGDRGRRRGAPGDRDRVPVGRAGRGRRARAPDGPWTLSLRRPAWAAGATVAWPGTAGDGEAADEGLVSRTATWRAGDRGGPRPADAAAAHGRGSADRRGPGRASRSSAGRSCTAWRPRTCRRASSSRRSPSTARPPRPAWPSSVATTSPRA